MHFRITAQIYTIELTPSGAGLFYTGGDGQCTAVAKRNKKKKNKINKTQKSSTFRSSVQSSSDAFSFAEASSLVSLFDSRRRRYLGVEEREEDCYCLEKKQSIYLQQVTQLISKDKQTSMYS